MSADGWNAAAHVPGKGAVPGQFFWLLTDAGPQMFEVGVGRRASFRQDICAALQAKRRSPFS